MDAARKFVDKGQIDKAVKEYLRIVQEDPKDVRVWLKIGDLYAKKGAKQDAIETYLKVARFYQEQGFLLKAVAVYKQVVKLDPRLVDVVLRLADLYRQLGQMSEAMQYFESVAAHFHREGNTKDALATVKKLVDLDPENIATRIKLAELYSKEGLVQEAAQEFEIACDQLRRQNRQDDFVKVAERLLWHRPDHHALNRELAGLYLRRNDPRRALQKLQAAFKADSRDVETLGLLAQAFQALDQKAKTVSVLKELARVHTENKQRDKAGDVFRKILEFVPGDQDAIAFLGPNAVPPPRAATPPPVRASTPLPPQVRAASTDARFNITGDLPAYPYSAPQNPNMTGSMPLVDEDSLSGGDFALPEYDDPDFSADMEPAPDPRAMSAAGEEHAEEISKILAETDVYVKYGLHQKAVDHLRRIFSLDPNNVEAHERLKDIFVSQNREQEAEVELLKLAEVVAPADPDRAEAYLHELLAMNGTHTGAFELARRFRLRVARMSSSSSEVEYAGGGVAAIDPDLDDLSLDDVPRSPQRPMGVARAAASRDSIDDFDPDELIGGAGLAHGSPAPGRPPQPPAAYQADDADPGYDLDLPFDPDEARRFDAAKAAADPSVFAAATNSYEQVAEPGLDIAGGYDPYGTGALQTPGADTSVGTHAAMEDGLDDDALAEQPRAETLVEDDLEEADFYAGQGLYPEAMESIRTLLERFPGHRLLLGKLRDFEAAMNGEVPDDAPVAVGGSTDAIDLDDIEEVGDDDLEELDSDVITPKPVKQRGPQVKFERPIEEGDADTHYDLGLAYKEMGLHDEAIKAFVKALRAPHRQVNCYVMIGLCHREQGNPAEAIHSFKQGLHAEPSERERQSIYYEIGCTYEAIGDVGEAVYYFEMVYKRDPGFADAAARLDMLRAQGGRAQHQHSADDEL